MLNRLPFLGSSGCTGGGDSGTCGGEGRGGLDCVSAASVTPAPVFVSLLGGKAGCGCGGRAALLDDGLVSWLVVCVFGFGAAEGRGGE